MKTSFNSSQANQIIEDFQFTKGMKFKSPHGDLKIDLIEKVELQDGSFQILVKHNAFAEHSIPEFFGFVNPSQELLDFLNANNIYFPCEKYDF